MVPAAGTGERAGERAGGKLFAPLCGRPLLAWTLERMEACPLIDALVIVTRPRQIEAVRKLARAAGCKKLHDVVAGGQTRLESVLNGVAALPADATHVVVHDGARPLCEPHLFTQVIRAAQRYGAAVAAVPATDTMKLADRERWVTQTLDRRRLWCAQTPQAFARDLFDQACKHARSTHTTATDDASLVENLGRAVRLVPGSPRNLKVTFPEDFAIAEALLTRGTQEAGP